jgi:hypothetical protein
MSIFGGKDSVEINQDVSAKAGVTAGGSAHQHPALSQSVDRNCGSKHQMSASSSSDDEILTSVDHRFVAKDRGSLCSRKSSEKEGQLDLQEAAKTAKKKRNNDKIPLFKSMSMASVQVARTYPGAAGSAASQERHSHKTARVSGSKNSLL